MRYYLIPSLAIVLKVLAHDCLPLSVKEEAQSLSRLQAKAYNRFYFLPVNPARTQLVA